MATSLVFRQLLKHQLPWHPENPRLKVLLTPFCIKLVRPGKPQPPDTLQFRIPMEMGRQELKIYLEELYNIPVADIRVRIQMGRRKRNWQNRIYWNSEDHKVAYVVMRDGQTFEFPDLFAPKEEKTEIEKMEDEMYEKAAAKQREATRRGGINSWF
ncbi:PREDICTED: 39S ribosomal protein L23, mitochondrial-like [Branchiostoma belcheri]|uniref:Large ribosomal subunit protein uL23m n=1 Tax=Branchiostoma belcheri TaxID=7741 RepID=A0A6P4XZW0_BRABE|nr:PREDICTED: 39S ribosomal protein L23, mitochondrial-like [Branchiostoma belcheri]KAI8485552.1 54S ribosomal protein L23, mitochondrial [Branchiostoma belcheri]KAI8488871.1 54S ribosomal protein L23, mitochondrial [Branchiostoma belcheri]